MVSRSVITSSLIAMILVDVGFALERSKESFRDYSARRLSKVDDVTLNAFVDAVDDDNDGIISDEEFANRILVYQRIFQTVTPVPGGGRQSLPENWLTDFDEATAAASESKKPILMMFSASWCGPCKMMIANVYPLDEAKHALEAFISVYVDAEKESELAARYEIRAFPTYVCIGPGQEAIGQHVGGGTVENFVEMLSGFRQAMADKINTTSN